MSALARWLARWQPIPWRPELPPVAVWFGCRSRRSPLAGQDRTMPYASWILFTSAGSAFERIAACSSAK